MRVRTPKAKPVITKATEEAIKTVRSRRGARDEEEEDVNWGELPANLDRASFEQRRIG